MIVLPRGHQYPEKKVWVAPFPTAPDGLHSAFPRPPGLVEDDWPPTQLVYLGQYLAKLGCKSVAVEGHYVDRDYIEDLALFYGRSLRGYPNYCQRLHFFTCEITEADWHRMAGGDDHAATTAQLQAAYLGFSVVRPLPGSPLGRTVVKTFGPTAQGGERRDFGTIREYTVHLASFVLKLDGLAFQQQDRGVSACATTALWCAIQCTAPREGLGLPSPATITEAASRYLLADGRALPSEGLTIHQICEATRATGLSPLVVRPVDIDHDRAQLLGYLSSGFAPVLALRPLVQGEGHAVCGVGMKLGEIHPASAGEHFRDAQTGVQAVYVHDDRLGPYATAKLFSHTQAAPPGATGPGRIVTGVDILWPDQVTHETSLLAALIIPVPNKLRLTVTRMRKLGLGLAVGIAQVLTQFDRTLTLRCYFRKGVDYLRDAAKFELSADGLYRLTCETVLSRYVGIVELTADGTPVVDFLLDATESGVNPAVLACVQRRGLSAADSTNLSFVATRLATAFIR